MKLLQFETQQQPMKFMNQMHNLKVMKLLQFETQPMKFMNQNLNQNLAKKIVVHWIHSKFFLLVVSLQNDGPNFKCYFFHFVCCIR